MYEFALIVGFCLYDFNWNIFCQSPRTSGPHSVHCPEMFPTRTKGSLNESRKAKTRQQPSKYCHGYSLPEGF